jgi:hypothetical protein
MKTTVNSVITGTHPYADKFPMLPEQELEELAESIRANGLRTPVVLTPEGLILDGRNRAAACSLAGTDPDTITYEGDDLAEYVIDCNSMRRNMATGARAMATALVLQAAGRRGNGRWKRGSVDISGSANNSGWKDRLKEAGIILDFKPDLAPAVASGDLALHAAYQQANEIRTSAELPDLRCLQGLRTGLGREGRNVGRLDARGTQSPAPPGGSMNRNDGCGSGTPVGSPAIGQHPPSPAAPAAPTASTRAHSGQQAPYGRVHRGKPRPRARRGPRAHSFSVPAFLQTAQNVIFAPKRKQRR